MFERYTEKARRVIFFARFEASEFGSPQIEPEHLLLALFREVTNLQRFVSPQELSDIRSEIAAAVPAKPKTATSVDLPLSLESKRILAYAAEESDRLALRFIAPEHQLVGLLRESAMVRELLDKHAITLAKAREWAEANGVSHHPAPLNREEEIAERERLRRLIDALPADALDRAHQVLHHLSHRAPSPSDSAGRIPVGPGAGSTRSFSGISLGAQESVFESHRMHAGKEFRLIERLRLSEDQRTLHYAAELRGPAQTENWSADLDVSDRFLPGDH